MNESVIRNMATVGGLGGLLEANGFDANSVIGPEKAAQLHRYVDSIPDVDSDEAIRRNADVIKKLFVEAVDRLLETEVSE